MTRTQGDIYAIAAEHANRIERASIIAHYARGEDVEFHADRARKAFAELAAVLGYYLSKVESAEKDTEVTADPTTHASTSPGPVNCSTRLRLQKQAYPRTCARCGLGPCPFFNNDGTAKQ